MEIKKGISQMAEYPNVEINYVVPENGNMYYVMRDGVLESGAIIATLDPKHAIDESNHCDNMGVFAENGSTLVDFNKKEIRKITDNLVLAVASNPVSIEVAENVGRMNDEISKVAIEDNANTIINKLKEEMGTNGEIIFDDPYSEANVYSLDSYNNKVGLDCSFIGKNEKGLYFHTTDVESETKFITVDEFQEDVPETQDTQESVEEESVDVATPEEEANEVEEVKDVEEVNSEEDNDNELNIEIDQDILAGFKNEDDEDVNQIEPEEIKEALKSPDEEDVEESTEQEAEDTEEDNIDKDIEEAEESDSEEYQEQDGIFENAIDTISKLVEETKKLSARIEELEDKLREQEEMIDSEEKKKDELNDILDRANEVLETMK